MRLLFARIGIPHSPATGLPIESQTVSQMVDQIMALPEDTRIFIMAPLVRGRKGEYKKELTELLKKGFSALKLMEFSMKFLIFLLLIKNINMT